MSDESNVANRVRPSLRDAFVQNRVARDAVKDEVSQVADVTSNHVGDLRAGLNLRGIIDRDTLRADKEIYSVLQEFQTDLTLFRCYVKRRHTKLLQWYDVWLLSWGDELIEDPQLTIAQSPQFEMVAVVRANDSEYYEYPPVMGSRLGGRWGKFETREARIDNVIPYDKLPVSEIKTLPYSKKSLQEKSEGPTADEDAVLGFGKAFDALYGRLTESLMDETEVHNATVQDLRELTRGLTIQAALPEADVDSGGTELA